MKLGIIVNAFLILALLCSCTNDTGISSASYDAEDIPVSEESSIDGATIDYQIKKLPIKIEYEPPTENFINALNKAQIIAGKRNYMYFVDDYVLFSLPVPDENDMYHLTYTKLDGSEARTLLRSDQKRFSEYRFIDEKTLFLGIYYYNECLLCYQFDILSGNVEYLYSISLTPNSNERVIWHENKPYIDKWDWSTHTSCDLHAVLENGDRRLLISNASCFCMDEDKLYYQKRGENTVQVMDLNTFQVEQEFKTIENAHSIAVDGNFLVHSITNDKIVLFDIRSGDMLHQYDNIGEDVSYTDGSLTMDENGFYITGTLPGSGGLLEYYDFDGSKKLSTDRGRDTLLKGVVGDYYMVPDGIYVQLIKYHQKPPAYHTLAKMSYDGDEVLWIN